MINKVLNDRYKIVELIGRGGMAVVYKAIDLKLNREVAVKVLREEYTENEQFIKKFDRESQAAAGLSHPNIVSVFDVGVQDKIYYIIMEYVDGITLKQYLNKKGTLDHVEATQYILEVAGALKCAHEHKIIHRDIKPHNILLTKDLTPKVADFGIARAITSSTVTVTNQTMGSVHYISPEQARGGFVDECSDLYSLGIMYYELLTGQLPFDAESSVSIAIKHIQEAIVPPKNLNSNIPDSVNEVVLKLTQKKPEDRYQNAQELIDDLDMLLDDFEAELPISPIQTGPLDSFSTDLFTVENTGPLDTYSGSGHSSEEEVSSNKNLKPWIIAAAFFIVLVIGFSIFAANNALNQQVIVPNVVNLPISEAQQIIESAGLKMEIERQTYSEEIPVDYVISQSPSDGSTAREGSTVKLTVSQGVQTVDIPDVIGLPEDRASTELTNAGLDVEIQREFNSDYDSGIVFNTDPGPGVEIAQGKTVTIYVSRGEDTVSVPGIVGLTQSDAIARLEANNLNAGTISQQSSNTYPSGVVISQSPTEGTTVSKGTYVRFVVSTGPPTTNNDYNNYPSGGGNDNDDDNGTETQPGIFDENNENSNPSDSTQRPNTNN